MPTIATTLPTAPSIGNNRRLASCLFWLITCLTLLGAASRADAQLAIDAGWSPANFNFPNYVDILEDDAATLTFANVVAKDTSGSFRPVKTGDLNLRHDVKRYWLRFEVVNNAAYNVVKQLHLSPASLRATTLFCDGREIPPQPREQMLRPKVLFELVIPASARQHCYLQIDDNQGQALLLDLDSSIDLLRNVSTQHFVDALFLGSFMLLLLVNLGAARLYGDTVFLWLGVYSVCAAATLAVGLGYTVAEQGMMLPWPNPYIAALFLGGFCIEQVFVLRLPMYPKPHRKIWASLISGAIVLNLVTAAISAINTHGWVVFLCLFTIAFHHALMLSAALVSYLRTYKRSALLFLLLRASITFTVIIACLGFYFNAQPEEWIVLSLAGCLLAIAVCYTAFALTRNAEKLRRHLEEQRQLSLLEDVNRAKTDVLARLTHDIRTPMSAMLGVSELLAESPLNHRQREYIQTLQRSSHELLQTLEETAQSAHFSEHSSEPTLQMFNLHELISDSLNGFRNIAAERNLDLVLDVDTSLPTELLGDPARLKQLQIHAMNSAFEHSEQGFILLRVYASPGRRRSLSFEYSHTGKAFSERERQAINGKDSDDSLGIGNARFAIMSTLARQMSGQITLRNGANKHHSLCFSLPVQVSDQHGSPPAESQLLHDKRLLIVDENPTFCDVVAKQCKSWGMDVFSAASEQTAIALIRNQQLIGKPIDIVLIDQKLPNNGLRLAGNIAAEFESAAPNCILLAFANNQLSRRDLDTARVGRVLSKPVAGTALRSALLGEFHYNANRNQRPTDYEASSLTEQKLRCLIAEDNPTNAKVLCRMLETMGIAFTLVENGEQAVNQFYRDQFDVIILDIEMPVMDGIEACTLMRKFEAREGRQRTPIFGLTANAMDEQRDSYLLAGMDLHLIKPLRLWELAEAMKRWTRYHDSKAAPQPLSEDGV